ncbi:MAG: hypothetical protein ACQESR_30845, partial [Planctomycetota bacterium]
MGKNISPISGVLLGVWLLGFGSAAAEKEVFVQEGQPVAGLMKNPKIGQNRTSGLSRVCRACLIEEWKISR